MALTQRDSVLQMLAQLRVLDPSVSAELGTPERKILDTVAQQIADSSVDLAALSSAFDLDSKSRLRSLTRTASLRMSSSARPSMSSCARAIPSSLPPS
jgi:hypothetical protein